MTEGDDFRKPTKDALARRAAYICSNPGCMLMTITPSTETPDGVLFVGRAAHITSARPRGARFDPTLSPEERAHINNGIFLCAVCADMIDDNNGADFSVTQLLEWKQISENWVRQNLNKKIVSQPEAVRMLRKMTGSGSVLNLMFGGDGLDMLCRGDYPFRDLELTIRNDTEFDRRMQSIRIGMSGYEASALLDGAIVYKKFFHVLDFQAQSAVVRVLALASLAPGQEVHYSYRATALSGNFSGHVFVYRTALGKVLSAAVGFSDGVEIHKFPSEYPTVGAGFQPNWPEIERG